MALTPDLESDISSELVRFLLDRDLAWEMRIDNLSLLRDTGTRQILEYRLEFRGGEKPWRTERRPAIPS